MAGPSLWQFIRTARETWEAHRVEEPWRGAHAYELVGRVVRDGGFYYVEKAEWLPNGYEWRREPRKYVLPQGALRAITEGYTLRTHKIME